MSLRGHSYQTTTHLQFITFAVCICLQVDMGTRACTCVCMKARGQPWCSSGMISILFLRQGLSGQELTKQAGLAAQQATGIQALSFSPQSEGCAHRHAQLFHVGSGPMAPKANTSLFPQLYTCSLGRTADHQDLWGFPPCILTDVSKGTGALNKSTQSLSLWP